MKMNSENQISRLRNQEIPAETLAKFNKLLDHLAGFSSIVVAYSGGVDSSFLAWAAWQALGKKMIAVTVKTELLDQESLTASARFAKQHGFRWDTIQYDIFKEIPIINNHSDRCYHCKKAILTLLWQYARINRYVSVVEGQNVDDQSDHRPGRKAIAETKTASPLVTAHLDKMEIRRLAKAAGLNIWDKPSSPCLATRFPYNTPFSAPALKSVQDAEQYLNRMGFNNVRVRFYGEMARIEINPNQMAMLIEHREEIVRNFHTIGFLHVALDLQGYRKGSMDEGLIT